MDYPYVFLDAIYCKARVGHRVLSQAIVVAFGVAADGRREVLGFDVGDPAGSAAKVHPSFSAFAEGVRDAFAFDLMIYLRESGHDREQHRPHACCRVDVATAEV